MCIQLILSTKKVIQFQMRLAIVTNDKRILNSR